MNLRTTAPLVFVLLVTACTGGSGGDLPRLPGTGDGANSAVEVPVATVARENIAVPVTASGATEPLRAANLGPQLTARIAEILVQDGQQVEAGQPLVRLDVRDASLRAAQAMASAAAADVQAQQAASEYQRLAPLAQRGTIPTQQIDMIQAQRDALANAARAANTMVAQARRGVTESVVRAPFAGTVSKVLSEVGEVATMMPPTILVRLVDLSQVEVTVRVHERDLARVAVGDPVEVRFPSLSQTSAGFVTFISPEIDPRSRTAGLTTRIPNPLGTLRSGLFAELRIQPSLRRQGLVVPRSAVIGSGDQATVYAVRDGRAERRVVKVAPIDDDRIEIVEGLREGETVAAGRLDRLADRAAVRPRTDSAAARAPAPPLVPPAPSAVVTPTAATPSAGATP